jgi:hypothetical protein
VIIETLLAVSLFQEPNVRNPRIVEFTCPDHDRDDQHELDIRDASGKVIQTLLLGDPAAVSGVVSATINVQPIAFGTGYTVVVRAVAGTAKSDNSTASNAFDRVPGTPANTVIR